MGALEKDLDKLALEVTRMGRKVGDLLMDSLTCLETQDKELAAHTVEADKIVNLMEYDIENRVVRILALRQPVALDLRSTIIAIKIAADLERMGDLAKAVAKKALTTMGQFDGYQTFVEKLGQMGRFAHQQLNDVLQAYERHSQELAFAVWQRDAQLDSMNDAIFSALMQHMGREAASIGTCAHFLFVAKSVERIGDHVCNIAELVKYELSGEWSVDEWVPHPTPLPPLAS